MGGGPLCEYPPELLHNGIYLPLLHAPDMCCRDPIILAYTAGHFSAVVAAAAGQQPNPISEVQAATMSTIILEDLVRSLEETPTCVEAAKEPVVPTPSPLDSGNATSVAGDASTVATESKQAKAERIKEEQMREDQAFCQKLQTDQQEQADRELCEQLSRPSTETDPLPPHPPGLSADPNNEESFPDLALLTDTTENSQDMSMAIIPYTDATDGAVIDADTVSSPEWIQAVAGAVFGDAAAVSIFLSGNRNGRDMMLTAADVAGVSALLKQRTHASYDCSKLIAGNNLLEVAAAYEQWSILSITDTSEAVLEPSASNEDVGGGTGSVTRDAAAEVAADTWLSACTAAAVGDMGGVHVFLQGDGVSDTPSYKPSLEILDSTTAQSTSSTESMQRKARMLTLHERDTLQSSNSTSAGVSLANQVTNCSAAGAAAGERAQAPLLAVSPPTLTGNSAVASGNGNTNGTMSTSASTGAGDDGSDTPSFAAASETISCSICLEDVLPSQMTGLRCKHFFCNSCYQQTLMSKVRENVSMVQCPYVSAARKTCSYIVDDATAAKLLSSNEFEEFQNTQTRTVKTNDKNTFDFRVGDKLADIAVRHEQWAIYEAIAGHVAVSASVLKRSISGLCPALHPPAESVRALSRSLLKMPVVSQEVQYKRVPMPGDESACPWSFGWLEITPSLELIVSSSSIGAILQAQGPAAILWSSPLKDLILAPPPTTGDLVQGEVIVVSHANESPMTCCTGGDQQTASALRLRATSTATATKLRAGLFERKLLSAMPSSSEPSTKAVGGEVSPHIGTCADASSNGLGTPPTSNTPGTPPTPPCDADATDGGVLNTPANSAAVGTDMDTKVDNTSAATEAVAETDTAANDTPSRDSAFIALYTKAKDLLPIRFLSKEEQAPDGATQRETCKVRAKLLVDYLDVYISLTGVLAARQRSSTAVETSELWSHYLKKMKLRQDTGTLNMRTKAIFAEANDQASINT